MKLLFRIAFFKIVCYEDTILNFYQNRVSITVLPKHDFKVKLEIFFFLQLINAMYSKIVGSRHSFNS